MTYERTREWKLANPDAVREQKRRYKKAHPDKKRAEDKRYRRTLVHKRMRKHTFLAVDGEGWNDANGSHNYHMIVTSETDLNVSLPDPLTTEQCLAFIANIPKVPGRVNVSYFFDYDVTMILRDMAQSEPEYTSKLFDAGRHYVWWHGYGIKYVPHKSFTVKRWTDDDSAKPVVIHDMQGFFQSSFVVALQKFNVGTDEERAVIAGMKDKRSSFTPDERLEILRYSQHECRLLVGLAEKIRDLSEVAGINAFPYEGPGAMASRAMTQHYGKIMHEKTIAKMPQELQHVMPYAMYGGRFETTAVGAIPVTVREYDRHSAYPAIMSELPCLFHGKWVRSRTVESPYALTRIEFRDDRPESPGLSYALPIRRRSGELHYPRDGAGWYWESEYKHIETLDYRVSHRWAWIPGHCGCHPFRWIHEMFAQREQMEHENKGSGIALKLTLNTLYGKCAQTRPVPGPWLNFAYASMITSALRADMYRLYSSLPEHTVFMYATDAIFTSAELETSHGLGGLELADTYNDLTIVQPGLYFDGEAAHFKTRGIPKKYIREFADQICVSAVLGVDYPLKTISFYGLRLALATGRIQDIGQWQERIRIISTRTLTKRTEPVFIDGINWTLPIANANPNGGESMPRKFNMADFTRMVDDISSDDETLDYDE